MLLLKNAATDKVLTWLMVLSADHITPATGLSPTVTISKNGAAFAAPAGTVAEVGNGWYKLTPSGADTTTNGLLLLHATAATADPADVMAEVVAIDLFDAVALGLSAITAIKAKTDQLVFTLANKVDASIQAAGDFAQAAADKVWSTASRTLTAFSTALAVSVWDVLEANIAAANSIGVKLKAITFTVANKVDASIQAAGDFAQAAADKVWASATRTLTAFSTALALSVWDVLTSAIVTASTIGLQVKTNLDAVLSAVKAKTDSLTFTGAGKVDASVRDWLGTAPNVLIAGRVDGNVQATAAALSFNLTGNVTGNLSGSVGSVTADVGITQSGADKVFGGAGAVVAELAQGIPPATPRPGEALMLLYMALRNLDQVTATEKRITNDAGTVIAKKALSDDGTTYAEAEMVSGP